MTWTSGNGAAINNNLNANQEDQQFVTLTRVSQIEQRHPCTKAKLLGPLTPHATLIICCEVQIGETQKCTSSLQWNYKKKDQIENVDSQDGFRLRNWEFEPRQKVVL
jgi:hypothetical protein